MMQRAERIEGKFREAREKAVARSVLDTIALIFLIAGVCFWTVLFYLLLAPPSLISLQMVPVIVLALTFALGTPLLVSALVPTTPAGQMLQQTQWLTIGFGVIIASAAFLTFKTFQLLELWLHGQPAIAEAHLETGLAMALTIAMVVIPALSWVQLTPERFVAALKQAHDIRKLRMLQDGEIAILRNKMIWMRQKTLEGYVNMLPDEQRALLLDTRGLIVAINQQQKAIAHAIMSHAEVEKLFMGDQEIVQSFNDVSQLVEMNVMSIESPPIEQNDPLALVPSTPAAMQRPAPSPRPSDDHAAREVIAALDAAERAAVAEDARRAVRQGDAARDDASDGDYTVAFERYGTSQAWTVRELAETLSVAESTARERKMSWEAQGRATGKGQPNGRYRFIG